MIQWLQDWYSSNCDGDWEHDYGITIETIDNPGWNIKIDVVAVDVTLANKDWKLFELSEKNWLGYKIEHHVFYASGDAHKLESLIMIFKMLMEKGQVEDAYIYEHFL